jgi:hypothetical protein
MFSAQEDAITFGVGLQIDDVACAPKHQALARGQLDALSLLTSTPQLKAG